MNVCEEETMKVLGLRASSSEIRYAILEKTSNEIQFVNQASENKMVYPAYVNNIELRLKWTQDEMNRVIRQNPNIDKIIIKTNEYAGSETSTKRETIYIDAIFLLVAAENNIQVVRKLYSQIGAISKDVKEKAEARVGRTDKYWNSAMADAIACAYWEIRSMK